jgi:hypothetical protein
VSSECSSCGRPLVEHNRHVRFTLPDPVLDTPEQERTPGTWMSHANAYESVMMQVPDVGAFVRALLPIRLTDGHAITFGVWIAIDPAHLQPVFTTWWEPAYQDLRMAGWLANAISPWGLLSAPVQTVVRNADETPYCDSSSNLQLDRVLHEEWPHDLILAAVDRHA